MTKYLVLFNLEKYDAIFYMIRYLLGLESGINIEEKIIDSE